MLQRTASGSTHTPTGALQGVSHVATMTRQGSRGNCPSAPSKPLKAAPAHMRQSARRQAMRATLGPTVNGCKCTLACGTSFMEVSLSHKVWPVVSLAAAQRLACDCPHGFETRCKTCFVVASYIGVSIPELHTFTCDSMHRGEPVSQSLACIT